MLNIDDPGQPSRNLALLRLAFRPFFLGGALFSLVALALWGGFWLTGMSGTGKSTLARIIAASIADDFFVTEYDSADDFTARECNRMIDSMCLRALGKGGRAWIINEAHGLRPAVIRRLLGILERLPDHCVPRS